MISKDLMDRLVEALSKFPSVWKGKEAILEMKDVGYPHWKQMEWIGFYFQFLCDRALVPFMEIPGPKYGKVEFDGFAEIPWDFKAHPHTNSKGLGNNSVIVNDRSAIMEAIAKFGEVGLILGVGKATYNDVDRSFQLWHQELKGGLSIYEKTRVVRDAPSRLRKTAFTLEEIQIVFLDKKVVDASGSFQEGFRNSDGSPRKAKVVLKMDDVVATKSISF